MTRRPIALSSWIAFGAALVAPQPSRGESPQIAFEESNAQIARITSGPVARNWTWHCDDPSDQWPLTQRCQVYDVTDGGIGSGSEVLVVDDDCGTAASDPTTVVYNYTVTPEADHRYAYVARCTDSATYSYYSAYLFYYDTSPPTVTLEATPPDPSASDAATFGFSCSDNSQGFELVSGDARCFLYCTLERADTNQVLSSGSCDDFEVTDSATIAEHSYSGLSPRRYRFRVRGQDEGGALSTEVTYEWTVLPPPDGGTDAAGDADGGTDASADAAPDAVDDQGAADGAPLDGSTGDGTAADGANDSATGDGSIPDGANDSATGDGAAADGASIPDGAATSDASIPDGAATSDASIPDGAVSRDGAVGDGRATGDMGPPVPAGGGCGCGTAPGLEAAPLLLLGLLLLCCIGRRRC